VSSLILSNSAVTLDAVTFTLEPAAQTAPWYANKATQNPTVQDVRPLSYLTTPTHRSARAWDTTETTELYLYSSSGSLWPVLVWTVPLPLPSLYHYLSFTFTLPLTLTLHLLYLYFTLTFTLSYPLYLPLL